MVLAHQRDFSNKAQQVHLMLYSNITFKNNNSSFETGEQHWSIGPHPSECKWSLSQIVTHLYVDDMLVVTTWIVHMGQKLTPVAGLSVIPAMCDKLNEVPL